VASLGWVKLLLASTHGPCFRGKVLRQGASSFREGKQLESGLLISAALHHQLDQGAPFRYQLHVAFKVTGHRYPATLYRVTVDSFC
jgi:hypothetical protein